MPGRTGTYYLHSINAPWYYYASFLLSQTSRLALRLQLSQQSSGGGCSASFRGNITYVPKARGPVVSEISVHGL